MEEGGKGLATGDEKGLECQIEECGLYPESSGEPLKWVAFIRFVF